MEKVRRRTVETWRSVAQVILEYFEYPTLASKILRPFSETKTTEDFHSLFQQLRWGNRLNMELDLQSLFGLLCTAVLVG